ncbi:Cytochrome c553 [Sphingopyxis flava]|uniref:Cytochrome c553 n=1 Tax=Sphingopyxis flava TaxID=1507287 RepID=A0A1T5BED0_9SPHN|nr:Cytochrome c553 [Sphingopyxis flava]
MRFTSLLWLVPIAACSAPAPESRFRESGEVIAFGGGDGGAEAACFTCHGIEGQGDGRASPRLAGLDKGYLHRQLDDFASGRRDHAVMRAIARRLDGGDRSKVAAYYAGLPIPANQLVELQDSGAAGLYNNGDAGRDLAPCASCHGSTGEGAGPGNPPLAGQPAAYIAAQLAAFRDGSRNNDALGEMRAISRRLTGGEIRAVADHVAALPAARPRAVRAASREGHRGDPRNDVSVPHRRAAGSSPPAG